jgi:hypothetical protein
MFFMSKRPIWFKAKRYGWGWYPATWQGWLVTLGYIVAAVANSIYAEATQESARNFLFAFFPPMVLLTLALLGVCYLTGEKPRWRWGGND